MPKLIKPKNYAPKISPMETQRAIKKIKDYFQQELAYGLNLRRVSAPLFVAPETGLNDNLNGVERRVSFTILDMDEKNVEIVQSLAKWKRMALGKYGIKPGHGIYTDMNETVTTIYNAVKNLGDYVNRLYRDIQTELPNEIYFITSQELEDLYPDKTAKERENLITRAHGAVFIEKIGGKLRSGEKHDGRSPDYDDWELNGDILLWDDVLEIAFEISSMGIRVDSDSMERQLKLAGAEDRKKLSFQRAVLDSELPLSIGGGIGQSRLCMFFLRKAHIGEVQVSVWPKEMDEECRKANIFLL